VLRQGTRRFVGQVTAPHGAESHAHHDHDHGDGHDHGEHAPGEHAHCCGAPAGTKA
jgi:hypothetical protein